MTAKNLAAICLALFTAITAAAGQPDLPAQGVSVLVPSESAENPARYAGILEKVLVREGQMVQEGETLAQVDLSEAELLVQQADLEVKKAEREVENEGRLKKAQNVLEFVQSELKRAERLQDSQPALIMVSESEMADWKRQVFEAQQNVEDAKLQAKRDKDDLAIKRNTLLLAKKALEKRKITASISGVVAQVNRRKGEWVEPGQTVFRLLRLDRLKAEGLIKLEDKPDDLLNRPVRLQIEQNGEAKDYFGKVVFVSPEVNPVNRDVRFTAEFENPKRELFPGMKGQLFVSPAAE